MWIFLLDLFECEIGIITPKIESQVIVNKLNMNSKEFKIWFF